MSRPYALLADMHCHAWSAFSSVTPEGMNSRLVGIMDEFERAAKTLIDAGGDLLVIAGDLFHTRGAVDPEVFNYVHRRVERAIRDIGISIVALPGNHDLAGRETTELGNSFKSFRSLGNFEVADAPMVGWHGDDEDAMLTMMVPWHSTKAALFASIEKLKASETWDWSQVDLIIHAGIDGVLPGMPDHGLTAAELEAFGFRRVFAGHYHNHKVFPGGKVISIGATTHQKWNDVGTKAGFLIVHPDRVDYHASHQPCFVDVTGETDPDDVPLIVDGHYVRVSAMKMTAAQTATMRDELMAMGARGVVMQVTQETVSVRTGAALKTRTLSESVQDFVGAMTLPAGLDAAKVLERSHAILNQALESAE